MKKRIARLLLAAVTLFSVMSVLSANAFAESYGIVRDYDDVFTDDEEAVLVELLDEIAASTGYNMAIVSENNIGSMSSPEYARDAIVASFGADSDAILLLISNDYDKGSSNYDWIEFSGKAADERYEEINDMLDCFYGGLDANGYFAGALDFCGYFGADVFDPPTESTPAYTYKVNLADYQDKIPASEQVELLEIMQLCAEEIQCNVGVVITDDIQGMSDENYTKKFMEDSFGKGSNSIALLMNNDRSNDYYGYDWIYTNGLATDLYDHQTEAIFDYLYIGFDSDGGDNYAKGIEYFCACLINYKDGGIYNDYNDYNDGDNYYQSDYDNSGFSLMGILVPIVIAVIVSACVTSGFTSGYSKKKPISAKNYMDSSKTKYNRRDDIYLRETTTHVRISSSSGGGGGSRGGGGGRSRSGGGGGGGRRR